MIMLRFVFRRWSSKKTPTFPVEKPLGQTTLSLDCPDCGFRQYGGPRGSQVVCCMCCSATCTPATCARARGVRTRGNDD